MTANHFSVAPGGPRSDVSAATDLPIAFVGSYPPRRCGIATFTRDISHAVAAADERVLPMTVAVTDPEGQYEYPSDVRLVSIQHEYGIFGGDDGAYILDFLAALRVPAVATLHTVLKEPSTSQRAIVRRMARQCAALVVMSRVAADLLGRSYGVEGR